MLSWDVGAGPEGSIENVDDTGDTRSFDEVSALLTRSLRDVERRAFCEGITSPYDRVRFSVDSSTRELIVVGILGDLVVRELTARTSPIHAVFLSGRLTIVSSSYDAVVL